MVKYFVYILLCADSTFYTGYTNNIEKRIENHNKGKASKYTRGRLPVKLVYQESFLSKTEALKREIDIKKKSRIQKLHLIHNKSKEVWLKKIIAIDSTVLPNVFIKVLEVKEILRLNPDKGISDVVKKVGISRSTFYKYKDYVFSLSESIVGTKAIIGIVLIDEKGVLSSVLNILSKNDANILTINQDIPINKVANASITIDTASLKGSVEDLISKINNNYGVLKCTLLALG